jgi:hypothetical protein
MNIRCSFCQTPYTLSRVIMLDALQEVDSKNLTHYDAHCPRCRRATPIPRKRLEMAMPNWREELKQFEKDMKENPQQEAPIPKPEAETAPEPRSEPETAAPKKPAAKPRTPATAKAEAATKTDKKPAAAKKTTSKKSQ